MGGADAATTCHPTQRGCLTRAAITRLGVRRHLYLAGFDPGLCRGGHHHRAAGSGRAVPGAHRRAGDRQRAAAARAISGLRQAGRHRARHRLGQDRQPARGAACGRCATMARNYAAERQAGDRRPWSSGSAGFCAASSFPTRDRCSARRGRRGGQLYFGVFDELIRSPDPAMRFRGPIAPPAARSGQRAAVLPLHAPDP